jgi:hypothetical protein
MKIEAGRLPAMMFIAGTRQHPYLSRSMIRLMSSMLVALALFVSPLLMASGASMAMPHAAAASGTQTGSHCADSEAPAEDDTSRGDASCASACAAFPAIGPAYLEEALPVRPPAAAGIPQALSSIHPEGELRPPRITPEI